MVHCPRALLKSDRESRGSEGAPGTPPLPDRFPEDLFPAPLTVYIAVNHLGSKQRALLILRHGDVEFAWPFTLGLLEIKKSPPCLAIERDDGVW